jgi:hypothetical protein
MDRRNGLATMIYVLVFLHFVNTDHLKYYQVGSSYADLKECEVEMMKAKEALVIHKSQTVVCLEVAGN